MKKNRDASFPRAAWERNSGALRHMTAARSQGTATQRVGSRMNVWIASFPRAAWERNGGALRHMTAARSQGAPTQRVGARMIERSSL